MAAARGDTFGGAMRLDASVQWNAVCCTAAAVLGLAACSAPGHTRELILTTRTSDDQILGNVVVRDEYGSALGTTDALTGELVVRVPNASDAVRLWLSPGGSDPRSLSHSPGWLVVPAQEGIFPLAGQESYTVRLSPLEAARPSEGAGSSHRAPDQAELTGDRMVPRWSEDDLPLSPADLVRPPAAESGPLSGDGRGAPADFAGNEHTLAQTNGSGAPGSGDARALHFAGRMGELRLADEQMFRMASEFRGEGELIEATGPRGSGGVLQGSGPETGTGNPELFSADDQSGTGSGTQKNRADANPATSFDDETGSAATRNRDPLWPQSVGAADPSEHLNTGRSGSDARDSAPAGAAERREENPAQWADGKRSEGPESGTRTAVQSDRNAAGELLAAAGLRGGDPGLFQSLSLEDRAFQVNMITGEPVQGARVSLISTQKNWELEFGTTNADGYVAARVPSGLSFQLLRVEHLGAGVLVAPVTFSSEKRPARLTFSVAPGGPYADKLSSALPGVPFSLAFSYPSYGRLKFFRGGSLEISPRRSAVQASESTSENIRPPLAPPDEPRPELLPWRQTMNSLSHFVIPAQQWTHPPGARIDGYSYVFQFGDARASGSLNADLEPTSAALHHDIKVLHQDPERPRATLWYTPSRELQSLDQTLVGRFQRAVKARFINARSFVPVVPERVAELASDAETGISGWRSTPLEPELDYIVVLSVEKMRLSIEWRNRAGKVCSEVRLPFPAGRPPEYFANEVFNAIEENFPDEVVVRVSAGESHSGASAAAAVVQPAERMALTAQARRDLFKGALTENAVFYLQALEQNRLQHIGQMRVTGSSGSDVELKGWAAAPQIASGSGSFSGLLSRCPADQPGAPRPDAAPQMAEQGTEQDAKL